MLPQIEGTKLPTLPWNTVTFERVLDYYDGPRLLLQRSQAGQLYLGWWNDSDETVERWVYLPLSALRLYEIVSGAIPSLEALKSPEDGYLLAVDIDLGSESIVQTTMTTAASLPQDSLPLEGARLDMAKDVQALAKFFSGRKLHDQEGYRQAIDFYAEAIELDPDMAVAFHDRGDCYVLAGDYDRAIQDFNEAIVLDQKLAAAYASRGAVHSVKGDHDSAIQDFNRAITLEPGNANTYFLRGQTYLLETHPENAILDFNKVIQLEPRNADVHCLRGAVYMLYGNYDGALQDFNSALELKPDYTNAYNYRGTFHFLEENYDSAIQDLTEVIKLEPRNAHAHYSRGLANLLSRHPESAIQDFVKALELDPGCANAYVNPGEAWLHVSALELAAAETIGKIIPTAFHDLFGSVADYEQKNDVKLPEPVAAMLT